MSFSRTKKRSKFFLTVLLIISFINCIFPGNLFASEPKGYMVAVNQGDGDSSFPDSSLTVDDSDAETDESVSSVYKETDESVVSVYEEELPFSATLKKLLETNSKGSVTSVYENPYTGGVLSPGEQGVFMKRISNMPEFEEKPSAFTPSKIARYPSELDENKIVSNVADKTNEVSTDLVIIDEDFPVNFDYLNEIKPADEEKEEGDTAQTVANKV